MPANECSKTIHKDTIDEINMGFCEGITEEIDGEKTCRCMREEEVTEALGPRDRSMAPD